MGKLTYSTVLTYPPFLVILSHECFSLIFTFFKEGNPSAKLVFKGPFFNKKKIYTIKNSSSHLKYYIYINMRKSSTKTNGAMGAWLLVSL